MDAKPPSSIRFAGDRSKPDYPAVAHLLRNYAAHLGAALVEVAAAPDPHAWSFPPALRPSPRSPASGHAQVTLCRP